MNFYVFSWQVCGIQKTSKTAKRKRKTKKHFFRVPSYGPRKVAEHWSLRANCMPVRYSASARTRSHGRVRGSLAILGFNSFSSSLSLVFLRFWPWRSYFSTGFHVFQPLATLWSDLMAWFLLSYAQMRMALWSPLKRPIATSWMVSANEKNNESIKTEYKQTNRKWK